MKIESVSALGTKLKS